MLRIQDLVFDAYGRRFFDGASVALPPGAKVGLVGRNGAGKTTLFRLIKGELSPGGGEILLPRAARIGAADQEHAASDVPLIEQVLVGDAERAALAAELATAPPERIADIYARLAQIGADAAPAKAAEILVGLGFSQADLERPMSEFSGGWRMRAALAAALFAEPELLLLDEPTNFLDLEGALWLESRLKRHPSTALVISHDRELLDRSMGHILHLADAKLTLYSGSFSAFERQRSEQVALQGALRSKIEARRAHLQSFVDRFRAGTKARQAQSRLKMIERLGATPPVVEEATPPFLLPSPERPLPPPLLRLEGAAAGYGGAPVLERLNLRLDPGDRIGLLGVNGAGKTTLARVLAGDLPLIGGRRLADRRLKVGWFHEHQTEALAPDDTPVQILGRALPALTEAQRRGRLGAFGFGQQRAQTRIESLSGGERARLLINLIGLEAPNLIILDEPTNHLDIDSRRALVEALNDYEGAVVLISHDRSLIEMAADRLWLAAEGTVRPFDGDLEDYARLVLERARSAARMSTRTTAPPASPAAAPSRRRLDAAESTLARETRALADLDAELASLDGRHRDEAVRLGGRRERLADRLRRAEAAWLAAAEAYEASSGD